MKLFHPLLAMIASATESELAKYVRYLKEENRILRDRLPTRVHTKPHERARLLKFGRGLGRAIEELITIVKPRTFQRWVREEKTGRGKKNPKGRPKTAQTLRELVKKIAAETGFGYTRIIGELRRLGITKISRQTVRNIIREEGLDPAPKRSQQTWDEFLKTHAETLWACDFFSVRSVTRKGIVRLYMLVFLHVDSRRVIVSPATEHPDSAWVTSQAESFLNQVPRSDGQKLQLLRDRDTKFSRDFVHALREQNVEPITLPIASPNLNGRVERFIQTIKNECLRKFILFGHRHVDYLVAEFVDYYNDKRAHSARDFLPPACTERPPDNETVKLDEIVTRQHLGGLITSFGRRAA